MSRKTYFIIEYLEEIKDYDLETMRTNVKEKLYEIKYQVKELKYNGINEEFLSYFIFYQDLKSFNYFINFLKFPENINSYLFKRCEWIVRKLIKKGQMDSSILLMFN